MQKVIRRTILAEKQAARRLGKRKAEKSRQVAVQIRSHQKNIRKLEVDDIKNARLNRKEDYELGPLAPKRDVGDKKDSYATLDGARVRGQQLDPSRIAETLKDVGYLKIGREEHVLFAIGDRVVLLEGRDKGKIGMISSIDIPRGECAVEGMNMVETVIPEYMRNPQDMDKSPTRAMEKPVPLTSIRLVHPMQLNPNTGIQDVIIKKLIRVKPVTPLLDRNGAPLLNTKGKVKTRPLFTYPIDEETGKPIFQRHVDGFPDLIIPFPKPEPEIREDTIADTLRVDVEARTFVPTLFRPPIPTSVIDELRNKFSVFRTRHDPEYIEAKMEEDRQVQEKKQQIKLMRTPTQEVNRLERKLRRKKGKGVLTEEMLERIGKMMLQKRLQVLPLPRERSVFQAASVEA